MDCDPTVCAPKTEIEGILQTADDICARWKIAALDDFRESCRVFALEEVLNVAVVGRFKAGKSSFLNHLLGMPLLPTGALPVTSVVTEIEWGPGERIEVVYADGRMEKISPDRVSGFVSEKENPGNAKRVARVRAAVPAMERYRGIRFVDTPGLESVFEHNTEVSLNWLPNVGLALVAVGVDPPLSQRDLELIRRLARFTPRIAILLTKVDIACETERLEVRRFIEEQLARSGSSGIPVFPFSIRGEFAELREQLDEKLLSGTRTGLVDEHRAVLEHKARSLLGECKAWLDVALRSAETADSERRELRGRIIGQGQSLDDARLGLRLMVRHARGATRAAFEVLLKAEKARVCRSLSDPLDAEFPAWARNLSCALLAFEGWLQGALCQEMTRLSAMHSGEFLKPLERVNRQLEQSLQDFRNRVSDHALETLGVPLRTTEMEFRIDAPNSPDVRVGRIFDRNWELVSWLIPMTLARGMVRRHFHRKLERLVETNLSRLASQWEEAVNSALAASEKEAARRLDRFVASIEELTECAGSDAARIREDMATITSAGWISK